MRCDQRTVLPFFVTIFTTFDNLWTILKIFDHFDISGQFYTSDNLLICLTVLTILRILYNFDNDNVNDNPRYLWPLRHCTMG